MCLVPLKALRSDTSAKEKALHLPLVLNPGHWLLSILPSGAVPELEMPGYLVGTGKARIASCLHRALLTLCLSRCFFQICQEEGRL